MRIARDHAFRLFTVALFAILPAAQAQALEKFAAIEIGGSNVKFVRLDVDGDEFITPDDDDNKVDNPGLSADLGDDGSGLLAEDKIGRAVEAVSNFVKILTEQKGVPPDHIAVIGSSGLVDAKNRDELVAAVRQATRITMDFVTSENEVRFTLLGVVPSDELFSAHLVDIGSSNTKWGHLQPGTGEAGYTMVSAALPSGSKTLATTIENQESVGPLASPVAFLAAAKEARGRIRAELSAAAARSEMNPQQKVYLSGGAPWAMVTLVKPESALDDYVRLTRADYQTFERRLTTDVNTLFNVDYSACSPEAERRARDDLATVRRNVFNPAQIVAGGQILLAFREAFKWDETEVYFARQGYKAWITGYVREFARKKLGLAPDTSVASVSPLTVLQTENAALKKFLLRREWTRVDGRAVTATVAGCTGGKVLLEAGGNIYPLPLEDLSPADRRYLVELSQVADALAIRLPELRTWTAAGSGRTVEAALIDKQGDQVRMLRKDGQLFRVASSLLSTADQQFLAAAE